uniref:Uncharacterized protein n=1 Tax=viral metagenome TaxID=1070528 RepID=A0A6C0E8C7_9ZZZZ
MLSREVSILLVLVMILLCLVSWTSVQKETFDASEPIKSLETIEQEIKIKRDSQNEQEKRLEIIEKMINDLESKMNNIKNNSNINPSQKKMVSKECSYDDPYCLMNNNHMQIKSVNHWAQKLS